MAELWYWIELDCTVVSNKLPGEWYNKMVRKLLSPVYLSPQFATECFIVHGDFQLLYMYELVFEVYKEIIFGMTFYMTLLFVLALLSHCCCFRLQLLIN